MRVKCLAQEVSTQCPWPGLEPEPLAVESSTLNMRTPSLPLNKTVLHGLFNNKLAQNMVRLYSKKTDKTCTCCSLNLLNV